MSESNPSIEQVTGYLGIGALEVLGVFFVLDGISGFLVFVETYAKTSAWVILVSIPLLVVSYILGLCSSVGAEWLSVRIRGNLLTSADFVFVSTSDNAMLIRKYGDIERNVRLLYGCSLAFLIVAFGSFLEVPMMGQFGFVGWVGLVGASLLSAICFLLARQLPKEIVSLLKEIEKAR